MNISLPHRISSPCSHLQVAERLPRFSVRVALPTLVHTRPSSFKGAAAAADGSSQTGGADGRDNGEAEGHWEVAVEIERVSSGPKQGGGRPRVYAPRFPKVRRRSVGGDVEKRTL